MWTSQRETFGEEIGVGIGGRRAVGHAGGAIGGNALLMIYPDYGVAIAVAANIVDIGCPQAQRTRVRECDLRDRRPLHRGPLSGLRYSTIREAPRGSRPCRPAAARGFGEVRRRQSRPSARRRLEAPQQLGDDAASPAYCILTAYGVGYRMPGPECGGGP